MSLPTRRVGAMAAGLLLSLVTISAGWAQVSGGRGGPIVVPPSGFPVYITSNVPGAVVYINGTPSGTTPYSSSLTQGVYAIIVRAPGYRDYVNNVTLSGPTTINAYLTGLTYNLSVVSNVNGAQVIVNGQTSGQTPITLATQPGTYTVQVVASGYQPFSTQVTVNQDTAINAQLLPSFATLRIILPGANFNPEWDRNRAERDIAVWVDGQRVGRGDIQVPAGNHVIRIGTGGWSVQTSYYFTAGQLYVVSPQLSITINPSN